MPAQLSKRLYTSLGAGVTTLPAGLPAGPRLPLSLRRPGVEQREGRPALGQEGGRDCGDNSGREVQECRLLQGLFKIVIRFIF